MSEFDFTDGDNLNCVKCDKFVSEIDTDGFCPTCATQEKNLEIPYLSDSWFLEQIKNHPDLENCKDCECIICGYRDCPHHEPLHYHHDGCPACIYDEEIK